MDSFASRIDAIKAAHLYRKLRTLSTPQGREVVIDGQRVLLFSSNSYLGLNTNEHICRKAIRAVEEFGVGSGGSRLVTGNMAPHMRLEAAVAEFKGSEAALAFTSGYTANVGVISSLCHKDTVIFSDALNHASIIDGCRLARGLTAVYAHNDMDDLLQRIRHLRPRQGFIVTDSVFSMDGDIARLPDLASIARTYGLTLVVDDAHATGVLGATGRGSLQHFGLSHDDVPVVTGTLSKAVPSEGGFVCGSSSLCDLIRNTARSFIFTTAPSPSTAATASAGLEYIAAHPELVARLQGNVAYFVEKLGRIGMNIQGQSPIIPIMVGDEEKAARAAEALLALGVFAPCIRYPTVPKGMARLRLTVMAAHTREDLDYAATCLEKALAAV
ncbi:MAG: 8-amino-7-oxononanoate synthase [Desulfovibrio sp.]|uniref:8-amino-7-oxononanoate synthase n=1 Tax=Desulfovibrio sp. TaxID=885 RepID=UPI0039E2F4E6